ncbi:MAG: efflux RND transporter permease subunit, partial [Candidatus Brocadiales bacterium]
MFLSDVSIRRPIFTTMMMVGLVIFGIIGYLRLGVDEFPNVDYPYVGVYAILRGASPEVVEADVTEVLEEEINTIQGIKNLTSSSSEGVSLIVVEFELGRDIDAAAQDVRDKVSVAMEKLPKGIENPVVEKEDPQARPMIWLAVTGDRHIKDLSDYGHYDLKPKFETLEGVGSIMEGAFRKKAMRIWLNTSHLEAYQLTVADVLKALTEKHIEVPGGRMEGEAMEFSIRTEGELQTAEEFNRLIIDYRSGAPVRLSDVGFAEEGMEDRKMIGRYRFEPGIIEPAVGLGVKRQSGANTVAVSDRVTRVYMKTKDSLKERVKMDVAVDRSVYIRAATRDIQFALIFAVLLTAMSVILFLRSWLSTLFIFLAIPTSFMGTFGIMYFLGFTLNSMTLLALSLAAGEVVDDAIIVLENIFRHREEGEDLLIAAKKGTDQVAFAALASTVSTAAVFIPMAFMSGVAGRFFYEFGITVAASVLISLFVALTLTPMLCARWLRLPGKNPVYRALEWTFIKLEDFYKKVLAWVLRFRYVVVIIAVVSFVGGVFLWWGLGKELITSADEGQFMVVVKTPVGSSLDYTDSIMREVERVLDELPETRSYFAASGFGGGSEMTNRGIVFVHMTPWWQRNRSQREVVNALRGEFSKLPGFTAIPLEFGEAFGARRGAALEFTVYGPDLDTLSHLTREFTTRMKATKGIIDVDSDLELGRPTVRVSINRDKAADLGVDVASVGDTIRALMGGLDVTKYKSEGKRYDVIVRLSEPQRETAQDILRLMVRNNRGELIGLNDIVTVEEYKGLNIINRRNRQRSVTISANLERDKKLSEALSDVQKVAREILPEGYTISLAGKAETFAESYTSLLFALALATVITYMILASLFDSFVHPFTIMLAVPLSLVGGLGMLAATQNTLNAFSVIGLILIMGIVTKNSILLVDFTNVLRREGKERNEALLTAGPLRLRPILMTALTTVFGAIPVALGIGYGGEPRA